MSRRSSSLSPMVSARVTARVEPELVGPDDPLANIDGTTNALVFEAHPIGRSRSSDRAPGNARARCVQRPHRRRAIAHRTDPSAAAAAVTARGSGPPASSRLALGTRAKRKRTRPAFRGTTRSAPRRPSRERVRRCRNDFFHGEAVVRWTGRPLAANGAQISMLGDREVVRLSPEGAEAARPWSTSA